MTTRHPSSRQALSVLLTVVAMAALAAGPRAQASYSEGFESTGFVTTGHGPDGLIAAGWEFRNQSEPTSVGDWSKWNYSYQGTNSLHVDQTVGDWLDFNDATASSWAILPAIPGQVAGDELRFQLSSVIPSFYFPSERIQVLYSPTGGTDTGSDAEDVGDFTTVLADVPDPETHIWNEVVLSLPGSGRIAFRFYIPPAPTEDDFLGGFQIDNLSVGPVDPGPPLPGPGETVQWSLDISPVTISEITTIPAGGTVIVDPGVVVDVAPTATITLHGALIAGGLPGQPVTLQGGAEIEVFGSLDLVETVVALRLTAYGPGAITSRDSSFLAGSALWTGGTTTLPPFLDVDQTTFTDSLMWVGSCALRLTNSNFTNTYVSIGGCGLYMQNVSIDSGPQDGLNLLTFLQPVWLNDLAVTNSAGAGLNLAGVNTLVGPAVTLAGNTSPVQMGGSGILPGSTLPLAGNLENQVNVDFASIGLVGGNTWADVGIPYVISDFYSAGILDILPGVRVQLGPTAEFWGADGFVQARGTPDAPVVFERRDPALPWQGLQKLHRLENCIVDGGEVGVRGNSITSPIFVDNCIIRNCDFGTQNDVITRKTRFIDNSVGSWDSDWPGALDGATGANSFQGNGFAVQYVDSTIDAPNNWWDDPTGPQSFDNPGGQGQPTSGLVVTLPFLTSPPDFTDDPPIVTLQRNDRLLEPNSTVILNWTSTDDMDVVGHRIEFDAPLSASIPTIVADNLPGTQQAYEWTVPDIGFAVNGKAPRIRVIAIDTAGQEGWDASDHIIPSGEVGGTLEILSDLSGPYTAGIIGSPPLCWDASGLTGPIGWFVASVVLDADRTRKLLGTTFSGCLSGPSMGIPFASTDTARVEIVVQGTTNRVKVFYSEPFAIRWDSRLGDAPPSVSLLSPLLGQSFAGGSNVPITWTASDDEAVQAFHIQASYDDGHTWHFLAEDLPGTTTSFTWTLPPSNGIPDVRVRVIAIDQRFQNSSDGAEASFAITAGSGAWTGLGGGVTGTGGLMPTLAGDGSLLGGDPITLSLSDVLPGAPAWFVLGASALNAPFKGGTLVPSLDVLLPLTVDAQGEIVFSFAWPSGVPSGVSLYYQYWIQDPVGVFGFSASNGLQSTTP